MKTNILYSSLIALFVVSSANAAQYRPGMASYATEVRPFVGATIGVQLINWDNTVEKDADAKSVDLPQDFISFGAEAGLRFGNYHDIYNGGITLNFDITTSDDVEETISHVKIAEVNTMSISGTYDNYIRLSSDKLNRIDLVLGIGGGVMDEKTTYDKTWAYGNPSDDDDWATIAVFKAGLDFEMSQNVTLSATTRLFVPVKSDYDIDTNIIFGGSIKYLF